MKSFFITLPKAVYDKPRHGTIAFGETLVSVVYSKTLLHCS